MILSAQSIRHLCSTVEMITPFVESGGSHGLSYGLGPASYDVRSNYHIVLRPGDFAISVTTERLMLPANVRGGVRDKSTWARRGLSVFNTVIDPGFKGWLTLELKNQGDEIIKISKGCPIAQIEFAWLDEPTDKPYKGKYQDAGSIPQPAKFTTPDAEGV